MSEKILTERGLVVRHSLVELIEHWALALSGLILFFSGMFELPMANRYYITSLPGLGWSGDFITSLYIHYAASVVFVAVGLFHVVYHGLRGDTGLIPVKGMPVNRLPSSRAFSVRRRASFPQISAGAAPGLCGDGLDHRPTHHFGPCQDIQEHLCPGPVADSCPYRYVDP